MITIKSYEYQLPEHDSLKLTADEHHPDTLVLDADDAFLTRDEAIVLRDALTEWIEKGWWETTHRAQDIINRIRDELEAVQSSVNFNTQTAIKRALIYINNLQGLLEAELEKSRQKS